MILSRCIIILLEI